MFERLFGEEVPPTQEEQLKCELRDVVSRLSAARREFDFVTEPELIDGVIYEILSLSNLENLLVKKIKELKPCIEDGC